MPWDRAAPADPKYRSKTHRDARAKLIGMYQPGDPCCLCGHAMWPPTSALHADHDPLDPNQYRGLAHGTTACQDCGRKCNVQDGAKRGSARSRSPLTSSGWRL